MLDRLTSIKGDQFHLGPELGRGGEGVVYSVNGRAEIAIKVYKREHATSERRTKLRQMVTMASQQLAKHSAWPIDVVDNGVFAVVMPRVNGIEIHDLYGPKSRMVKMPKATFRFLIMSAYNLCAALHEIHQVGAVVGDFNQRNILISENAGVSFVDCDSFQIKRGSQLFKCTVGTPDQLAPELHGADLGTILRTQNHDNFTLAVLIFQLLFIGRHPFSGVGGPDEISEAIRRYLFAFGRRAITQGIRPPPHVPPADTIPPALFALFERAFADNSAKTSRPTPTEWAQHLQAFLNSVIKCRVNSAHEYISSRATCPWCELRVLLFLSDGHQSFRIDAATINELVNKLEASRPYAHCFTHPTVGVITPAPLPNDLDRMSGAFWFGVCLVVLALVGLFTGHWILALFIGFWAWSLITDGKSGTRRKEYRKKLEQECAVANQKQKSINENLRMLHEHYIDDFETTRRQVTPLKVEYNGLPARRQTEISKLQQRLSDLQLEQHLDRYFISSAGIPGIGPKRIATLRGYGIETAADVSWSMRAPGFGSDLTGKLVAWRKSCELRFRFNPNAQIDPREIQKIDATLQIRRNQIEAELHSINGILDARTRQVRVNLEIAGMELPAATRAVAQAKANLEELDRPTKVPAAQAQAGAPKSNSVASGVALVMGLVFVVLLTIVVSSKHPQTTAPLPTPISQPVPVVRPVTGSVSLRTNVDAKVTIERVDAASANQSFELAHSSENANSRAVQNLLPGRYRITFIADGWQRSKITEVNVVPGQDTQVDGRFDKVSVEFTSSPSGAVVKDGSVLLGTTPFQASLSAEDHAFSFSLPGRSDGYISTTIAETTQTILYSWPVGNLVIKSTPSGAEVWDGEKMLGTTPLNLSKVPIGDIQFAIVADGFSREEVRGTVKADLTINLDVTLTDIRPAKAKVRIAADGKRLRLENVGKRTLELKRILVSGPDKSVIEELTSDMKLKPTESEDFQFSTTITPQMTVAVVGDPKTIQLTYEWEPPSKPAAPNPFFSKSIHANLYRSREELVISNQASAPIRIQYILVVRAGEKSPVRVNVGRDVAPKRSLRIDLRIRIDDGDTVQIATEPGMPSGAIDFRSF